MINISGNLSAIELYPLLPNSTKLCESKRIKYEIKSTSLHEHKTHSTSA